jgi:hypothetical protein
MPTITPNIALILTADKLVNAIAGAVPKNSITKDTIAQLTAIYHTQALAASDAISAQRVLRKIAATQHAQSEVMPAGSQRVNNEAWMDEMEDDAANYSADTTAPVFEVDFTMTEPPPSTQSPIISQNDYDSPPSANTQHHCQGMITQDSILHVLKQASKRTPFSSQQAASRRYPLQFLHDMFSAILEDKTGELLEYLHLMKHPKYKDV